MTNPCPWFAATTLLVGSLVPSIVAAAAALPVKIDAFQGEVVQVSGAIHSGVSPGKALASGTEVKTGRDGRADLSLHGAPTLSLGPDVQLLVHSMDQDVLRLRVASGALRIDTRAASTAGGKARDVRLNAGDLRLRLAGAEAWVEVSERSGQVCVISGAVQAQQATGLVRLDTPGQCLRQTGQSLQWTMVPMDLMEARVSTTGVATAVATAASPAAPRAPLQIKVLPLPGTLPEARVARPEVEVVQQAPSTSPVEVKLADVEVPVVPDPPPPLPVVPAAATTVALALPTPAALPEIPPAPAPLPVAPAPAEAVAMKSLEAVEPPVVPDPPAPLPVTPAPAETVSMKLEAAPEAPVPALLPEPAPVPAADPGPVPVAAVVQVDPVPPAPAPAQVPSEVAMAAPATASASTIDDGRRWRVVLGSMPEKEKAEMEAERLNARGWAVEAREYRVGERHGFRIGFGEFLARQDAQRALEEFLVQYPDAPAWLAKY